MEIKRFASQWLVQAKDRRVRQTKKRTNNEIDENNDSEN